MWGRGESAPVVQNFSNSTNISPKAPVALAIGPESPKYDWGLEKGIVALTTGFENSHQGSTPIAPAVKAP